MPEGKERKRSVYVCIYIPHTSLIVSWRFTMEAQWKKPLGIFVLLKVKNKLKNNQHTQATFSTCTNSKWFVQPKWFSYNFMLSTPIGRIFLKWVLVPMIEISFACIKLRFDREAYQLGNELLALLGKRYSHLTRLWSGWGGVLIIISYGMSRQVLDIVILYWIYIPVSKLWFNRTCFRFEVVFDY